MFLSSGIDVRCGLAVDIRPQVMARDASSSFDGEDALGRHPAPRAPLVHRRRLDAEEVRQRLLRTSCGNGTVERVSRIGLHVRIIRPYLRFCQQGKPKNVSGSLR